jgi:hypothetical protein
MINMQQSQKQINIGQLSSFLFWMMFLPAILTAQESGQIDTLQVYKKAGQVPKSAQKNPAVLAQYLAADYEDEAKKVLAISYWIAKNIKFNYKVFRSRVGVTNSSQVVLKNRKAQSNEYAQLFKEMCSAVGVQAEVVRGYTQGFDFFETDTLYRAEHTWSIVRINEVWQLLDLTYGSGATVARKQSFQKFLARKFGVKYTVKYKYVHQFNPRWFFVKPDDMIFTHLPNLSMFQLLKVPLPHKLFKQGGWLIHGHLSWYYKTLGKSKEIDDYVTKTQTEKWLYEGDEGHKANSSNHRVKGVNYYLALDYLFQQTFEDKNGSIDVLEKELDKMENYASIVDSMLRLSIKDNNKEYHKKQAISMAWKQRLMNKNKKFISSLNLRQNKNKKQEKDIAKINQKYSSNQDFVAKNQYKKGLIYQTDDSLGQKGEASKLSVLLLHQIDSLKKMIWVVLHQKDSVMQHYADIDIEKICPKEEINMKIHRGNWKALRIHLKNKKAFLNFVYQDAEYLDKTWFFNSHRRADSINEAVTAKALEELYSDQVASYVLIKEYYEILGEEMQLIQHAKNKSSKNLEKDELYVAAVVELESQLDEYASSLKEQLGFQQKLISLLRKEIKYMQKSEKTLSDDIVLESYRHASYMEYRKFIKDAENAKMRFVLEEVSKIKSYIAQARKKIETG